MQSLFLNDAVGLLTEIRGRRVKMQEVKLIAFVSGGIGDQLYHFTQMRALASTTTSGTIDVGCIHAPIMRRIAVGCDWIGQIIDISPLRRLAASVAFLAAVRDIKEGGYSDAWFMHKSGNFKIAAYLAGIPARHGLSASWFDRWVVDTPLLLSDGGERRTLWGHRPFIAALDECLSAKGLVLDELNPTIQPDPGKLAAVRHSLKHLRRPLIVVNLFAADAARRWPIDHAVTVLRHVMNHFGASIMINSGPDAREYHAQAYAMLTASRQVSNIVDTDTLWRGIESDIALYHLADAYLGVDSFSANLAMNCNVKSAVLFYSDGDVLDYRGHNAPLAPPSLVNGKEQPCLTDITSDQIITALGRLLSD